MWTTAANPIRTWLDHRYAVAHASAYLDQELDPAALRRVHAHAQVCPGCHELLASLRRTIGGLRRLREPPPESVVPDVLEALRADGG